MDHKYYSQSSFDPKQFMFHKPNDKAQNLGKNLIDIVYKKEDLTPFQKVFYKSGSSKHSSKQVEEYRKQKNIQIRSKHDVPPPFIAWDQTYFPNYIYEEIKHVGFKEPTPIQSQAFPIILNGHDFIGIAQTGSGKTLAFLLPSIVHINAQPTIKRGDGPIVLVLAPTRELAMQIEAQVELFGKTSQLSSVCIYGGADKYPQKQALYKGIDIVIATPGRLIDFLENNVTNLRRVTYLVLDEADRMLDMGFEPQIRKIVGQIRPDRQTIMFSATWPKEVSNLARDLCQEAPIHIQIGDYEHGTVNKKIKQYVEIVDDDKKMSRVIKHMQNYEKEEQTIIFCQTQQGVENLNRVLNREGFSCITIHGDKSQKDRDYALEQFRSGQYMIMIATDVASRGLDVPDITHVVNYDFPKGIEDYIHRIGRTGRAGAQGTSISFLNPMEDKRHGHDLIKFLQEADQDVPEELVQFARSSGPSQKSSNNYYNNNYNKGYVPNGSSSYKPRDRSPPKDDYRSKYQSNPSHGGSSSYNSQPYNPSGGSSYGVQSSLPPNTYSYPSHYQIPGNYMMPMTQSSVPGIANPYSMMMGMPYSQAYIPQNPQSGSSSSIPTNPPSSSAPLPIK